MKQTNCVRMLPVYLPETYRRGEKMQQKCREGVLDEPFLKSLMKIHLSLNLMSVTFILARKESKIIIEEWKTSEGNSYQTWKNKYEIIWDKKQSSKVEIFIKIVPTLRHLMTWTAPSLMPSVISCVLRVGETVRQVLEDSQERRKSREVRRGWSHIAETGIITDGNLWKI